MKFLFFAALIAALYWLFRNSVRGVAPMSANDAAKLLNVAPGADAETVNAAHRRLIAKIHPDAGGSAALAAQVNEARDVLLRRLSQ
jgi:DnaJ homolog subfamily C member 19